MQAMRRYLYTMLAALLCAGLLVSFVPPSAQAAGYGASVGAPGPFDSQNRASTVVKVLPIAPLTVTCSDGFSATVDEIAESAGFYDLKAVAVGNPPYTYQWHRTIDGGAREAVAGATEATYALSQHARDVLEPDHTYVYTCVVTDGAENVAEDSVQVVTKPASAYAQCVLTGSYAQVEGYIHNGTGLADAELALSSPAFAAPQGAAGGKTIAGAWTLALVDGPADAPAYLDSLAVTLPAPGIPDGAGVTIVGINAQGAPVSYTVKANGGKATFSAPLLGAFAVAWDKPGAPTWKVAATAGPGGQINPAGERTYADGANAIYTVLPDEGYRVSQVLVDDKPAQLTGNVYTFAALAADHTIDVAFERVPVDPAVTFTVEARATGHGKVALEGGTPAEPATSATVQVAKGESATVRFLPEAGWMLDAVTVDRRDGAGAQPVAVAGDSFTLAAVESNTVIAATFKEGAAPPLPTHTVEASATEGGTIAPDGTIEVTHGGSVSFALSAQEGYALEKLVVDGQDIAADTLEGMTYLLQNIVSDRQVQAVFAAMAPEPEPPAYATVHAVAGEHGSISPAGDVRVERGSGITFALLPDQGYTLDAVTVDGQPAQAEGLVLVLDAVENDTDVHVTFRKLDSGEPAPEQPALHTVEASATPGGIITPAGTTMVAEGASLSCTFAPDEGYRLVKLEVDGSAVAEAKSPYTFADVRTAHTIRAFFEPETSAPPAPTALVTARALPLDGGEVGGTVSPAGSLFAPVGSSRTFYVYPNEGFDAAEARVNGQPAALSPAVPRSLAERTASGAAGAYRLEVPIEGETLVEVSFARQEPDAPQPPAVTAHQVSASAAAGGSLSPSGALTVPLGQGIAFSIRPDAGWHLETLTVDGIDRTSEATGGAFELAAVTADVRVHAVFAAGAPEPPAPVTHVVTATAGEHGSIDPAGRIEVEDGATLAFALAPDAGYAVDTVFVDGEAVQAGGRTFALADVHADTSLSVTFKQVGSPRPDDPPVDVTVEVKAQVAGTETSGGLVEPSGTFSVTPGTSQRFYAYPEEGFVLERVHVNGIATPFYQIGEGPQVRDSRTLRVASLALLAEPAAASAAPGTHGGYWFDVEGIAGETLVEVAFRSRGASEPVPPAVVTHTVTAEAGEGGTLSPAAETTVPDGGSLTLTARPDEGYRLKALRVDGADATAQAAGGVFELKDVAADTVVRAEFERTALPPVEAVTFTITASVRGGHGTIEPAGAVKVEEGKSAQFSFTPDAGYAPSSVEVDGQTYAWTARSYAFSDVRADHAIAVSFAPLASADKGPVGNAVKKASPAFAQTGDAPWIPFAVAALGMLALASAGVAAATRRRF